MLTKGEGEVFKIFTSQTGLNWGRMPRTRSPCSWEQSATQEPVAPCGRKQLLHKNQQPLQQEAGESPVNLQILISIDLWVNVRLSFKLINKTNRKEEPTLEPQLHSLVK